MSTLNEVMAQIEELKTIKADFKNAIIAQGGEITDNTPFTHYPYIINNLETGYRFGISIDDLIGDVDENGELQAPQTRELNLVFNLLERISGDENCSAIRLCTAPYSIKTISFPDLVDISSVYGLSYAFYNCTNLTSVDLSSLQSVENYGLFYTFYGCSSLTSADLSSLQSVGISGLEYAFCDCSSITFIDLSSLQSVENSGLECAFYGCSSLASIDLSSLQSVEKSGLNNAFYGCSSLASIDFSSLQSVGINGLFRAFYNCSSLTSVYFPSLTNVKSDSIMTYAFVGCTALTEIHFRADMQSAIEATTGYDVKWNATNATVYFDL